MLHVYLVNKRLCILNLKDTWSTKSWNQKEVNCYYTLRFRRIMYILSKWMIHSACLQGCIENCLKSVRNEFFFNIFMISWHSWLSVTTRSILQVMLSKFKQLKKRNTANLVTCFLHNMRSIFKECNRTYIQI